MAVQFNNTGAGVITLKSNTSGSWSYTLPSADGTAGYALGTNGAGGFAWTQITPTGLNGATFALNTTGVNSTVNVSSITGINGAASIALALVFKGSSGYFSAQVPDSTSAGGNVRGTFSWDMQLGRTASNKVAAQAPAIILGGYDNGIGVYSSAASKIICGGENNTMNLVSTTKGGISIILGGKNNVINNVNTANFDNAQSFIYGGDGNTNNYSRSSIINGYKANVTTNYQMVIGADSFAGAGQTGIGQCQIEVFNGGTTTTNATPTTMQSTASPAILVCQQKSAITCFGYCTASDTAAFANNKTWYITFVAKRSTGNIALVGTGFSASVTSSNGTSATWDVTAVADTANQTINISATGAASTAIRWALTIYIVQANF